MEKEKNNTESGFLVKNIILLQSNFVRQAQLIQEQSRLKSTYDINLGVNVKGNEVFVQETLTYVQTGDDKKQIEAVISMVGVFEQVGESKIKSLEEFGNINGGAIIFPFIREHFAGLMLKAGLGNALLPPVDFTNPKIVTDN